MEDYLIHLLGFEGYGILLGAALILLGWLVARFSEKFELITDRVWGKAAGIVFILIGATAIVVAILVEPTVVY